MRVDNHVRREPRLGKRHVLCWPKDGHDALLTVPRGELVTDHGISREPKRYAHAGYRGSIQAFVT